MVDKKHNGMPIYHDLKRREIVSIVDVDEKHGGVWHPSNKVSRRLWGCLEIIRDINDLLEDAATAKNSGKKKRKAKIISGYVHSLAKSANELCKTIMGERDVRNLLGKNETSKVRKLQEEFGEFIPFQWNSSLTNYRNKLVAHFDDAFWPMDATELLNSVPTHKIGQWLHICLHIILDLSKLDIYSWSCETSDENYIRVMSNEPFIVTMKVGNAGEITRLEGVDIASESPKNSVKNAISISIDLSQWMFKKGQSRIISLREDSNENWNTFSEGKKMYEKEI